MTSILTRINEVTRADEAIIIVIVFISVFFLLLIGIGVIAWSKTILYRVIRKIERSKRIRRKRHGKY